MTRIVAAVAVVLAVAGSPGHAAEVLQEFACRPSVVDGTPGQRTTTTVLAVAGPRITSNRYALSGEVSYRDVRGKGYLEMLSHFPGGGPFFSRTLGAGPMQPLAGASDWRPFVLPFYLASAGPRAPEKLVLNVVLPGGGHVELRNVRLEEFAGGENPLDVPGQWWGDRAAGLAGGVAGAVIGILGALIGVLVSRGRARAFVTTMTRVLAVIGIALVMAGLYALAAGQPYTVYYPLLLLGAVSAGVFGVLQRRIRNRYVALELHRMQAQDR